MAGDVEIPAAALRGAAVGHMPGCGRRVTFQAQPVAHRMPVTSNRGSHWGNPLLVTGDKRRAAASVVLPRATSSAARLQAGGRHTSYPACVSITVQPRRPDAGGVSWVQPGGLRGLEHRVGPRAVS